MTDWSDDVRARALAVWQSDGMAAAHEATGVPKGTITGWVRKAGIEGQSQGVDRTRAATEARLVKQAEKRIQLQDDLLDGALEFVAKARAAASDAAGDGEQLSMNARHLLAQMAKNFMVSAGISVEKFRLEAGEVTELHGIDNPNAHLADARRRLQLLPGGARSRTG